MWREKFSRTLVRDRMALKALRELGCGALVVWECEVASQGLARRLAGFLEGRTTARATDRRAARP